MRTFEWLINEVFRLKLLNLDHLDSWLRFKWTNKTHVGVFVKGDQGKGGDRYLSII